MNKTKVKWVKQILNEILQGDGFFISFNRNPAGADCCETALVIEGEKQVYYILNGDFRKEFENLLPEGKKACLDFFEEKRGEFESSWSTAPGNPLEKKDVFVQQFIKITQKFFDDVDKMDSQMSKAKDKDEQ